MDAKTRAKILLFNAGYCTGLTGSWREYLLRFYRYLHTPRSVASEVFQEIGRLLLREDPDIFCFLEVHPNFSINPEMHRYPFFDLENKYGFHSMLRKTPFFRRNCNGFLAKEPLKFEKLFFQNGMKKLIYDIELPRETHLLMTHFSLEESVRQKQFRELIGVVRERVRVILCGDFNIFRGTRELSELIDACGLRIVNHSADVTFPSVRPKRKVDLFLCSQDITVANVKIIKDVHASDHLPVLLEVEM